MAYAILKLRDPLFHSLWMIALSCEAFGCAYAGGSPLIESAARNEVEGKPEDPLQRTEPIRDQYDRTWDAGDILAGPAVLILGGPEASETSTRWDVDVVSPAVRGRGVKVHRVLDLSGVLTWLRTLVKDRLERSVTPPGTPILLDWDGAWAARFECDSARSTVLLLDQNGLEMARSEGPPDHGKSRRFRVELDHLAQSWSVPCDVKGITGE